jgi:hypothetical protein
MQGRIGDASRNAGESPGMMKPRGVSVEIVVRSEETRPRKRDVTGN